MNLYIPSVGDRIRLTRKFTLEIDRYYIRRTKIPYTSGLHKLELTIGTILTVITFSPQQLFGLDFEFVSEDKIQLINRISKITECNYIIEMFKKIDEDKDFYSQIYMIYKNIDSEKNIDGKEKEKLLKELNQTLRKYKIENIKESL